MKQKLFLTSAIAVGFVVPAMAETFPSNGLMTENTTYDNAATETNMAGVYEGSVNATAEYTDILYQIAAGQYLPAGAESPIDCNVPGSFCPGLSQGVNYDENTPQGLTSCSTATNGEYTLSDGTGTSADSCYAANTVSCATRNPYEYGHATNVIYGNSINWNADCKTYYSDTNTCILDNENACQITGLTCEQGYTPTTYGEWAQANMDLLSEYIARGHTCSPSQTNGCDGGTYELEAGEGKVVFDYPINGFNGITYIMACSDISADANDVDTMLSPIESMQQGQTTGKYCWLRNSKIDDIETKSSKWVFYSEHESAEECARECAYAINIPNPENYMIATIMSMQNERFCAANAITINWSDVDPEYAGQNNEGTTFYGGNVRTPVKAQTIKGKTFKGWRFSKPTQTTTGN